MWDNHQDGGLYGGVGVGLRDKTVGCKLHLMRWLAYPLFFLLAGVFSLQACPTCKDSFTKTDGSNGSKMVSSGLNSIGRGFGWSVIFMLAAPASVASGLIWLVVKNARNPAGGKVS